MSYGTYLKELIDSKRVTKTAVCAELGISRPYLYAIFTGATPPPVPEKQRQLVAFLNLDEGQADLLYDLAAREREELPADIVAGINDFDIRKQIRENFIHSAPPERPAVRKGSSIGALRVPCCYQGGKQRVASEIVDAIFKDNPQIDGSTQFYDLCCGSGAYSVELMNRGINPSRITMLDISSWGCFWQAIGSGTFDMRAFHGLIETIPNEMRLVHDYMVALAKEKVDEDECYKYIVLQACSFGGKQIWNDGEKWMNPFFRKYWEPTATSVRRSPANPMQPSPKTLERRVGVLVERCLGLEVLRCDVRDALQVDIADNSIVYLDPPYRGTTGYAYGFDVERFIKDFTSVHEVPFYVSEGCAISDRAIQLEFGGSNGGISGNRTKKHQEWLNRIG